MKQFSSQTHELVLSVLCVKQIYNHLISIFVILAQLMSTTHLYIYEVYEEKVKNAFEHSHIR